MRAAEAGRTWRRPENCTGDVLKPPNGLQKSRGLQGVCVICLSPMRVWEECMRVWAAGRT